MNEESMCKRDGTIPILPKKDYWRDCHHCRKKDARELGSLLCFDCDFLLSFRIGSPRSYISGMMEYYDTLITSYDWTYFLFNNGVIPENAMLIAKLSGLETKLAFWMINFCYKIDHKYFIKKKKEE